MSITSFQFLGFVIVTSIVFRFFPFKKQWWVLLAASIVFYLSFSVGGIFVMVGTALLTYFAALWVQKYKVKLSEWMTDNKKTADKETRKAVKASFQNKQKLIVAGSIAITIGILFMCKYYKVLSTNFNNLFFIFPIKTDYSVIFYLKTPKMYSIILLSFWCPVSIKKNNEL